MQYAEIAVKTKTSLERQTFTYKINPGDLPYIKPGILVLVPFHGRNLEGIVLELKSHSPQTIILKSINKIIDTEPIITGSQIQLAMRMSEHYLTPIGDILFMMMPPIALRQISKIYSGYANKNNFFHGETYLIYDRINNRILKYIDIIKRAVKNNHGVVVLFPKIESFVKYIEIITKYLPTKEIAIIHGSLKTTERYKIYKEIIRGNKKVIIGSRSTIFSPVLNLGLIIIDQPEDFGYKENQSPKYYAPVIAKMIQKLHGVNLIFGSNISQIEDYKDMLGKHNKIIVNKSNETFRNIKITIVNQNNEKGLISNYLENKISNFSKGKILIYSSKKGEGSSYVCTDCNNIFTCSRCNLPLYLYEKQLCCHKCNTREVIPLACPNCNGVKLKSYGIGAERIKTKLRELFPNLKINIVDAEYSLTDKIYRDSDIIIGTKKIFDYNYKFQLTAVINPDNQLNLPDYRTSENVLFDLVNLATISQNEFIIQTHFPENDILANFNNPRLVLNKILEERKKYSYPPFSKIIKFIYKDKDENKCPLELKKMSDMICIMLKDKVEIIGSGPCFISKKRDKYYYQLIIKYLPKHESIVKKTLPAIKELSKWTVDVEPIDLL